MTTRRLLLRAPPTKQQAEKAPASSHVCSAPIWMKAGIATADCFKGGCAARTRTRSRPCAQGGACANKETLERKWDSQGWTHSNETNSAPPCQGCQYNERVRISRSFDGEASCCVQISPPPTPWTVHAGGSCCMQQILGGENTLYTGDRAY